MKKIMFFIILVLMNVNIIFANDESKDAFWKFRMGDLIDNNVGLGFSMDMAGPQGVLTVTHDEKRDLKILSIVILLSKDKSVKNSDELFFDLETKSARNAKIKSVNTDSLKTTVEFTSTLDFIRQEQGLLYITIQIDGRIITYFNSKLVTLRMEQ